MNGPLDLVGGAKRVGPGEDWRIEGAFVHCRRRARSRAQHSCASKKLNTAAQRRAAPQRKAEGVT